MMMRFTRSAEGFDSVIRTVTSAILALTLVGALVTWLLTHSDNPPEYLIALASSICSFYMGGQVRKNGNGNSSPPSQTGEGRGSPR